MVKREDFIYALSETIKSHSLTLKDLKRWFYGSIMEGANPTSFTRQNGARERVMGISSDDFLTFTLENVIRYYYWVNEEEKEQCQNLIELMENSEINSSFYFKTNSCQLLQAIDIAINSLYYLDFDSVDMTKEHIALFNKVSQDIEDAKGIKNIEINYYALNQCLIDILNGTQLKNRQSNYSLGETLYATQDIGRHRKNQEDSVLIMTHPHIEDFKFLAVSDGMGGVKYGEKASQYTIRALSRWFSSLPEEYYQDSSMLVQSLNQRIQEISREIYQLFNDSEEIRSGATLVCAVVLKEETIIANIGDSRAYCVTDKDISLITKDESYAYLAMIGDQQPTRRKLDDLRFARNGSVLLRCMGMENVGVPQFYSASNQSYDKLLLFSDGVTDALKTNKIQVIAQGSPTSKVADLLVQEAINFDAIRSKGEDEVHYEKIIAGHDNATAAVYDNSMNRRKSR